MGPGPPQSSNCSTEGVAPLHTLPLSAGASPLSAGTSIFQIDKSIIKTYRSLKKRSNYRFSKMIDLSITKWQIALLVITDAIMIDFAKNCRSKASINFFIFYTKRWNEHETPHYNVVCVNMLYKSTSKAALHP